MKTHLLIHTMAVLAGGSLIAHASPNEDVTAAARKLGDKANYSWKSTVAVPEGSRFRPGPTEGKTEKDGMTFLSITFGENTTQVVMKGDKGAISNPDGGWDSLADLDNAEGPRRFFGRMMRHFKTPVAQAADLVAAAKMITQQGDVYSGELTAEGAKTFLIFRPRPGGESPSVANPKGSVKFWLKDGLLAKYEFKVQGTVTYNNNDMEVDRTTTVEIKDVGATKVAVPEEAKKKVS